MIWFTCGKSGSEAITILWQGFREVICGRGGGRYLSTIGNWTTMVSEREEIDEEYKWSLESLFRSEEEWEKKFEESSEKIEELEDYEDRATESSETFLEVLRLREELKRSVEDLNSYASKKYDEDTRRDEYQAMKSRASQLSSKLASALSFLEPEIQDAGREKLEEFMEEKEELEVYEHFFDDILRFRPHTRSKEVENVIADLGDVLDAPDTAYKALMNADLDFPELEDSGGEKVEITQGNFTKLMRREDREFRKQVHEKFYSQIAEVKNAVGTNFEKNIKRNVKLASIRDHESARKASLFRNNVPVDVYDNLVETVESNLDALHKHLELKQEARDLDGLKPYDVYMPVTESDSPETSFEDARSHVLAALEPLGEEYVDTVREGLDSGWVDVYENRGKRSGAYSSATYDSHPYILMNYQDDVSSMYTLAHELGHSMHSYYTKREQPYVYSSYSIFVAEVASTVNEALLTRHLLKSAESEDLKRHALNHYLENFRNTLYRQTMFAHLEKQVHEEVESGNALTPAKVTEMYSDLKQEYHAPVELDDMIAMEWMRIPHFYYNFYVYQYATGISAAEKLVEKILEEGPEDFIEFLKAGASDYPVEVLRRAGVDMTESEPVESAVEAYRENLEEAEELL
jgi:oligoendopeptidase F